MCPRCSGIANTRLTSRRGMFRFTGCDRNSLRRAARHCHPCHSPGHAIQPPVSFSRACHPSRHVILPGMSSFQACHPGLMCHPERKRRIWWRVSRRECVTHAQGAGPHSHVAALVRDPSLSLRMTGGALRMTGGSLRMTSTSVILSESEGSGGAKKPRVRSRRPKSRAALALRFRSG
jgi:hypothetical protein